MWFWNGLSGLSKSLLERLAIVNGVARSRPVMAFAIVFVTAIGAIFAYRHSYEFMNWLLREPGQIVVNSPTVYTRQRLVNDRLNQTSWLQEQLKLADRPTKQADPPDFTIIDQVQSRFERRSSAVGAEFGSPAATPPPQSTSTAAADPSKDQPPGTQELFKVQPTTAALFRAKNAYREEVRGEMTQTQLDDRHDIRGNTIYRLSFDTTVIAGNREDAVAGIRVTLGHYPYGDRPPSRRSAPATDKLLHDALDRLYAEDYQELYSDWIRYTQRQVSASLDAIVRGFVLNRADQNAQLSSGRFLLGRICEFINGRPRSDNKLYADCDPQADSANPAERRRAIELLNRFAKSRFEELERDGLSRTKNQLKQFVQDGVIPQDISDADDQVKHIHEFAKFLCKQSNQSSVPLYQLKLQEFEDAKAANDEGVPIPILGCPYIDSPGERFISGIILYEALSDYASSGELPGGFAPSARVEDIWNALEKRRTEQCNRNSASDPNDKLCGSPQRDSATRCFAADFLKAKLNAFDRDDNPEDGERLGNFFRLRVVGRESNDCRILVSAYPRETSAGPGPAEELKYALNRNTEAFSYSVSPKNLSENISTAAQTRDAYELLARYGKQAGGNEASGFASRLFERSDQLQGILAHPVVVGFGSGHHPPEVLTDRNDKTRKTAAVRNTTFGWVIAPRRRGVSGVEQIDGQYALTAVISVPSWWRSVEVQVETCWISRRALHARAVDEADICNTSAKVEKTVLRLPGAISELSRKLGFEVGIQEPYLSNQEKQHELEIGEPGSLLLTGSRLWRSTEVTLGAQRANRISVLPNMEGIIATFTCVLPQAGTEVIYDNKTFNKVEVRVWTSEGVTEPGTAMLRWPAPQKNSPGDKNVKWCEQYPEVRALQ